MNSTRTRLASPIVLAALGLTFAVMVSSTGAANSLTSALSRQIQGAATKLQSAPATQATKQQVKQQLANMPLYFIENQGQMDQKVSHYLQGAGTSVYFTSEGLTYALNKAKGEQPASRYALKLDFVGANQVTPTPLNTTEAKINYFQGSPDQWKTAVPTSSKLMYSSLWPGIDLVYSGTGQKLKYEFHVAPGADPTKIQLAYRGADSLTVNPKGQLNVATPQGPLTDDRPFTYQVVNGKKVKVQSSYALPKGGDGSSPFGFSVSQYDRTKPLVIDPVVLVYSGFVGGDGIDQGEAVAVDASGAAYVTGLTRAADFPATAGLDTTYNGGPVGANNDAFVAKVNPAGTGLVYGGYIGGSGDDRGFGIAVDAAGAAYVAGTTDSTESTPTPFPLAVGPDLTQNGSRDVFVTKVNPSGTGLAYSGFIGGAGNEQNQVGIAVSPAGNAYLTGVAGTGSDQYTFPVLIGPDVLPNGGDDAFVAKVNLSGDDLVYAGYIGGSALDSGWSIAVDATGAAYVGGQTASTAATFPEAVGPDLIHNGGNDAFVAKVKPYGDDLIAAGYLGGTGADIGRSIAIDAAGAAYIAGQTASAVASFPETVGPDLTLNGGTDGFIAKVNVGFTDLVYCGYYGGSGTEIVHGVAVDASGAAYISGDAGSNEVTFPVVIGPDLTHNTGAIPPAGTDGFIAKVNPQGVALPYSGYLGGEGAELGRRVAVDASGNAYVTGHTASDELYFPVVTGPDTTFNSGITDAYLTKVSLVLPPRRTADFDGNGSTDVSLYRNGTWHFQAGSPVGWGGDATDRTAVADYNGNGTTDVAVYRVSTGTWYVKDQFTIQYGGNPADIPVPADYNGDGVVDLAVYRNGTWHIRNVGSFSWGGDPTDVPVPGDYNNDGIQDLAVYRKSTGVWYIRNYQPLTNLTTQWGGDGSDIPVPGDYNNDGATDLGVYRKATGVWYTKSLTSPTVSQTSWGGDISDVPVPGDYDSNGTTDLAVYRKDTGYWYVMNQFETSWGGDPADKALPLPSAIRD